MKVSYSNVLIQITHTFLLLIYCYQVFVGLHLTTAQRVKRAEEAFTNIFVKNFGQDVDEDKLKEIFTVS